MPLAALAVGAVYAYSFPGLLWLAGAAAAVGRGRARVWRPLGARPPTRSRSRGGRRPPTAVALAAVASLAAPEIGRMIDFASFETFDPSGPGLGNLFNRISPLEALGIWPSGDFRLDPGDGAVPAIGYYLGGGSGLAALAYGLAWWLRSRRAGGPGRPSPWPPRCRLRALRRHPYQAAKSIVIASPLAMLIAARALLSGESAIPLDGRDGARSPGGEAGRSVRLGALAAACCGALLAIGVLRCCCRLQPARARQRAGRAPRPTRRSSPSCGAGSAPARPSSSPRSTCSPTSTARLHRLGAARRPRLRRLAEARRPPAPPPDTAPRT